MNEKGGTSMKIAEVIEKVKKYHNGVVGFKGGIKKIDMLQTRDRILFGNPDMECTGIVTTCWANINVIEEAHRLGANLIICHEALFWNHGDKTEWLIEQKNKTFLKKKELLEKYGIVVWRDHDYIHSGIPMKDGSYVDGIFWGLADALGWTEYIDSNTSESIDTSDGWSDFSVPGKLNPLSYTIPETTVGELAKLLIEKLNINGVKVMGNSEKRVKKISIPFHVLGNANYAIELADQGKVDCFLTMEAVDFTLAEYVRDSSMNDDSIAIIGMGHFNIEEPGMKYMVKYIPEALGVDIPCTFVQSGDHYSYITRIC